MQRLLIFIVLSTCLFSSCSKKLKDKDKQIIIGFTNMSDLVTVEYTLSKIVKANDQSAWYKLGDRKIAMSVMAYAKAGIDLSKITTDQIQQKNNAIEIQVPAAKLISLSIPPDEIKQEMVAIGGFRHSFTNEEKNDLLKQAELEIRSNLDSIGIISKAEQNAKLFIEKFVKDLGYNKVNVIVNNQTK
jgi:hypothetical protein